MIYVDASVLLARILGERRRPADRFWDGTLAASRLLLFEVVNRSHANGASRAQLATMRHLLGRVQLLDLSDEVLARALEPFPLPVRTLDGLHLATMVYLGNDGATVEVASYDHRLTDAAAALGFRALAL